MNAFGEVSRALETTNLLQLLLAFSACIGYTAAQGCLLNPRGRLVASVLAGGSGLGFVVHGGAWPQAVMLIALAVAGLGVTALIAWLGSSMLGLQVAVDLDAGSDSIVDAELAGAGHQPLRARPMPST